MEIPFNFGKEIGKMSSINDEYVDVPITLKISKNIAELLKIFSISYSDYPTLQSEMLDKWLSKEVTRIVKSLATNPPSSEGWPESFKQYLKDLVNNDNDDN